MVVRLRAAAGEDDFLGTCAEERGDLLARGLDGGAGFLAKGVDGGGVAELGGEVGKHGVEHGRLDGGGGVEVEVDAVHELALRIASWRAKVKEGRFDRTRLRGLRATKDVIRHSSSLCAQKSAEVVENTSGLEVEGVPPPLNGKECAND